MSSAIINRMGPKVILIKKYENRRLYDTVNSRYVNLEDVARLLQGGATVRVVDAATGEDITRVILTQIIVEDAKGPDSIFPLEVLRQMVLASSRATQQGAVHYMQSMMDMYQRSLSMVSPGFPWPGATPADAGNAPVSSTVSQQAPAPSQAPVQKPTEDSRPRSSS